MTDAANTRFTTDELLSSAQGNATAFVLATIAYLKEQGLAVDDYVRFFGRRFAPGWEDLRSEPVAAVARAAALNAVSVGGILRSLSGDEERAELIIEGWPDEEISGTLGLSRGDGEAMWDSFEPIMEHLGIRYSWGHEEDGAVKITFERGRT
ncbi:MAG TPA: hypothetical protein VJ827_04155 [Rubrobacter sp.]|nr:hypothetical protein [Rubrobacter sp.]